jgi:hypothetical protein
MRKRRVNNIGMAILLIFTTFLSFVSCTNVSEQKGLKGVIEIKMVMDLDYKCFYYHSADTSVIDCEGQGNKCTQKINVKTDSIPQLVFKAFETLEKNRFEFNKNDGVFLSIVRRTEQKSDTLIFSGFSSNKETNELKDVDVNIYNLYRALKPCL